MRYVLVLLAAGDLRNAAAAAHQHQGDRKHPEAGGHRSSGWPAADAARQPMRPVGGYSAAAVAVVARGRGGAGVARGGGGAS